MMICRLPVLDLADDMMALPSLQMGAAHCMQSVHYLPVIASDISESGDDL